MSGIVDNDRPPYVSFERRAVEDRTASVKAGHYVSRDVDIATITRPGSRDSLDKEAVVWLKELQEKARKKDIPETWYRAFSDSYKAWKEGEEVPENGTPIKGWPVLSPAAQKDLISTGIRTVEDLAAMNDADFQSVGTGALAYKQKAVAWLLAAKDTGKATEEIAKLATQVSELVALAKAQSEEIKALKSQLPTPAPIKG